MSFKSIAKYMQNHEAQCASEKENVTVIYSICFPGLQTQCRIQSSRKYKQTTQNCHAPPIITPLVILFTGYSPTLVWHSLCGCHSKKCCLHAVHPRVLGHRQREPILYIGKLEGEAKDAQCNFRTQVFMLYHKQLLPVAIHWCTCPHWFKKCLSGSWWYTGNGSVTWNI